MGFPPPKDAPPPEEQDIVEADAGFQPSPTGATLCGFGFPTFTFSLVFRLPDFPPFAFPPTFDFILSLNCDLSDPIDAQFSFGGGRVGTEDPDADEEFGSA